MKKSQLVAGLSTLALSLSALTAPQALAGEPGTEPVTDAEKEHGAQLLSFAESDGAQITPGETLTFTADWQAEGAGIGATHILTSEGHSSPQWTARRGTSEEGVPQVTITAPKAPEEQFGTTQEYGEYLVHLRTSDWKGSVYFTIDFVAERTEEPAKPSEPVEDQDDLWGQLQQLSGGLSSELPDFLK
ncbi:MAG TPA: hypothetical protein VFC72_04440 [Corynebacterium sp.]|nr:hypothetical protein [Corynebacterium sp.]